MARRPADQIPQRRLLNLLRLDIEHAMAGSKPALRRVDQMVDKNPYSSFSTYVLYNLGRRRATWLACRTDSREQDRARAIALLRRYDAESEMRSFVAHVESVFARPTVH